MTTTDVRQNTPEWLAKRREGIGSSDAPVIAGERGSVVELWAEKSNLVEAEQPDTDTARLFEWGHRLEPVIAEWYTDTTGRAVHRVNRMLVHRDVPWAFASLDRVAYGEKRIVELKTERWGWRGDEAVPGTIQTQVQHQMWVTGYDVADVVVLHGGSEPHIHEIPRDDAFIDNLVFLEREFWGWVQSGTRPPMDGSENARRTLARMHPRNDGTLIQPDADIDRVFFDWMAARVVKDQSEAEVDTLANTLRALIGDADGIEGRVTWKRNKASTRTDWPSVAKAYDQIIDRVNEWMGGNPEATEADVRDLLLAWSTNAIESIHTNTAEGARVLRPVWKGTSE